MSQNIGGHRPTNTARRSAFPHSCCSAVVARIHRVVHKPMLASDAVWACQPRSAVS